jgi:uncharacterized membrane protein
MAFPSPTGSKSGARRKRLPWILAALHFVLLLASLLRKLRGLNIDRIPDTTWIDSIAIVIVEILSQPGRTLYRALAVAGMKWVLLEHAIYIANSLLWGFVLARIAYAVRDHLVHKAPGRRT